MVPPNVFGTRVPGGGGATIAKEGARHKSLTWLKRVKGLKGVGFQENRTSGWVRFSWCD